MWNPGDWAGLAAAVCMAGGLVSGLLWICGRSSGVPVPRLRRSIALLWLSLAACSGGLYAIRLALQGSVFDVDVAQASPVRVRALDAAELVLVAVGLAWTAGWLLFALRTARSISLCASPRVARNGDGDH